MSQDAARIEFVNIDDDVVRALVHYVDKHAACPTIALVHRSD